MTGCSAFNCTNRSEQGFKLKIFPKDPERRKLWASKVKRQNWKPTNGSYLCEVHFDADQWELSKDGSRKLKKTAVPTVFSHTSHQRKRKAPAERMTPNKRLCFVKVSANGRNEEATIEEMKAELEKIKKENTFLKTKLRLKSREIYELKCKLRKRSEVFPLTKVFNEDQIEALEKGKTSLVRWSDETVKTALGFKFSCGIAGYNTLLNKNLPYPSVRTLQRRLENIKFSPGILDEVFHLLKLKVESFKSEQEKLCNLALDAMNIAESTEFHMSTGTYFGNTTFPGQTGKANHALTFILGGLSTRWKQVVGYYFTNGQSDGEELKKIIIQIIEESYKIGLQIVNITSDMDGSNRAMWKCFGIAGKKLGVDKTYIPHPCDPTKKITFMADVPHLLKNLKSSLLNNKYFVIPNDFKDKYNLPSTIVDSRHLNKLLNYQENMELKLTPKLTLSHLDNKHFDKMKVSKATDVISHEVGAALKLIAEDTNDSSLKTTAWFLQHINKWFKLMTSRHPLMALSKFNSAEYLKAVIFLAEIVQLFKNIKIINRNNKIIWKPIQTGIIISTTSVLLLQSYLLGEKDMKYILTSRFTQDYVENFFSLVRSRQVVPTAMQFKNNLKLISISQYLKVSKGSYEVDDREFLPGFLDLFKNVKKPITKIILPKDWDKNNPNMTNIELNCLYNIAGYIISRLLKKKSVCIACVNCVSSTENIETDFSEFVNLKQYKSSCLQFVKRNVFLDLFCPMEILFRQLEPHLISSKQNCVTLLKEKFNTELQVVNLPACHNIKMKIINRFINFRLKIFGIKKNKQQNNSNYLASKSSAMRAIVNKI